MINQFAVIDGDRVHLQIHGNQLFFKDFFCVFKFGWIVPLKALDRLRPVGCAAVQFRHATRRSGAGTACISPSCSGGGRAVRNPVSATAATTGRHMTNDTAKPRGHSLIVAGNVYFCDFRKRGPRHSPRAPAAIHVPHDAQLTAEILQGACRELIAGAPALVRSAEFNSADLVSVASMIDELAFQAHLMGLENRNAAIPVIGSEELQQLMMDGAAVTAEIQSCMSAANAAAEQCARRLRELAERALRLGRGIAQALDEAPGGQSPSPS